MAGARGPTPADVRAMLRLSHALHTSADTASRKTQLMAALCAMLCAESSLNVIGQVERVPQRHTVVSVARYGPCKLKEEDLLLRCLPAVYAATDRQPLSSNGVRWRHIAWSVRPSRGPRLCHCLWRPAPMSDTRVVACLLLARGGDRPRPFSARERMLLHLAHTEMSWIYEADLLLASRGAASLSPRQRQTLQYLLAGHSEKQIAEILNLSRNTVHHYVKALHRHFEVSSRSELLARWVR